MLIADDAYTSPDIVCNKHSLQQTTRCAVQTLSTDNWTHTQNNQHVKALIPRLHQTTRSVVSQFCLLSTIMLKPWFQINSSRYTASCRHCQQTILLTINNQHVKALTPGQHQRGQYGVVKKPAWHETCSTFTYLFPSEICDIYASI